jgi:hypothetical protein
MTYNAYFSQTAAMLCFLPTIWEIDISAYYMSQRALIFDIGLGVIPGIDVSRDTHNIYCPNFYRNMVVEKVDLDPPNRTSKTPGCWD